VSNTSLRPLEHQIGQSLLRVEYADITTLDVDVIVSSDDVQLSMGGGVSRAILQAGGRSIYEEAQRLAPITLGDVAVTGGGQLRAKHVFHAAVLDYARRDQTNIDLVRRVVRRCMQLCDERKLASIAFPALATGVARLSPERSAVATIMETAAHLAETTQIKFVAIALFARPGLPADVMGRFYGQMANYLDLNARFSTLEGALAQLERLYGQLQRPDDAAQARSSRQRVQEYEEHWEHRLLVREPSDYGNSNLTNEDRKALDALLHGLRESAALSTPDVGHLNLGPSKRLSTDDLATMEREYVLYRKQALRAQILIRMRTITDIEVELAKVGFQPHLKRQLEDEQSEVSRLEQEFGTIRG
jgi:O-acetyl-ADP-ribose deacetylase (regulator of RNase III)